MAIVPIIGFYIHRYSVANMFVVNVFVATMFVVNVLT